MKKESKLNNIFRKNKAIFLTLLCMVILGFGVMATTISDTGITTGTGTYTNITADNINSTSVYAGNLFFGDTNGTFNETVGGRPLTSNEAKTITVCSSGCNYTKIQDAINQVPFILRHRYSISIKNGTYAEDVYVPAIVGQRITSGEGTVTPLFITGEDRNGVKIKSFQFGTQSGTWSTFVSNMEIYGEEPTSDENNSISAYGTNSLIFYNINFTGTVSNAIMGYSSGIYVHNSYFNGNQGYGLLLKAGSWGIFGDDNDANGNSGSVTTGLISLQSANHVKVSNNNNVISPKMFDCRGGTGRYNDITYCNNRVDGDVEEFIISRGTSSSQNITLKNDASGNHINFGGDKISYINSLDDDKDLRIQTQGIDRINIDGSTGRVSIGTTSTTQKLHVEGNLNVTGTTYTQKIIFALGETIDNIIDGWITITGGLKVTGDLNVTGTGTYTNITADSGTFANLTIGNVADDTGFCPNRPILSNTDKTITVCDSGCDYTLVNEALCEVPINIRHKYLIQINASTYTANENITISGVYGFGIGETVEGSSGRVEVIGEGGGYAKVNSIYVAGASGIDGVVLSKLNVSGINPYDDEAAMIALYNANTVRIVNVTFSGTSTADAGTNGIGILSYGSNVKINGAHFGSNHTHEAFRTKRGGTLLIRDNGADGNVTGIAYRAAIGQIYITSTSTVFAPQISDSDQGFVYNGSSDKFVGSYGATGIWTVDSKVITPLIRAPDRSFDIQTQSATGTNLINIDPAPSDNIQNSQVRLFRNTNTVGSVLFTITNGSSSGTPTFEVNAKTGDTTIGDGTTQANITMTSPNGTEYSCGVSDGGTFSCS